MARIMLASHATCMPPNTTKRKAQHWSSLTLCTLLVLLLLCAPGVLDAQKPSHSSEFNFASADVGAKIISASKHAVSPSRILNEDHDRYMLLPKTHALHSFFFVVELSEVISMRRVAVANFEYYSCSMKTFKLYGRVKENEPWDSLGVFEADNSKSVQTFELDEPKLVRYIMLNVTSIYTASDSFYCTLSLLRVHGETLYQDLANLMHPDSPHEPDVFLDLSHSQNNQQHTSEDSPQHEKDSTLNTATQEHTNKHHTLHSDGQEDELLQRVQYIAQEDSPITLPDIDSSSQELGEPKEPIVDPELLERLVDRTVIDKISHTTDDDDDDDDDEDDDEEDEEDNYSDQPSSVQKESPVETDSSTVSDPLTPHQEPNTTPEQPPSSPTSPKDNSTDHASQYNPTHEEDSSTDSHPSATNVEQQDTEQLNSNHTVNTTLLEQPQTNHSHNDRNTTQIEKPAPVNEKNQTSFDSSHQSGGQLDSVDPPSNETLDIQQPTLPSENSTHMSNDSMEQPDRNLLETNVSTVNVTDNLEQQGENSTQTMDAPDEGSPKKPLESTQPPSNVTEPEVTPPENAEKNEFPEEEMPKKPIESTNQTATNKKDSSNNKEDTGPNLKPSHPGSTASEESGTAPSSRKQKFSKGGRENILKSMLNNIQSVSGETNLLGKQMKKLREQYKEAFREITTVLAQKNDEINVLAESILALRKKHKRFRTECKKNEEALRFYIHDELQKDMTQKIYHTLQNQMNREVQSLKEELREEYNLKLSGIRTYTILAVLVTVIINIYIIGVCTGVPNMSGNKKRISNTGANNPRTSTATAASAMIINREEISTNRPVDTSIGNILNNSMHKRSHSYNHTLDMMDDWNSSEDETIQ